MNSNHDARDNDSRKKFDADDPRLTAYALGQLDDAERAEVEAWLATSEAGRQAVADMRDLAGMLEGELATEPLPAASSASRKRIADEIAGTAQAAVGRSSNWRRFAAVAAALLVAAAGGVFAVQQLDLFGTGSRSTEGTPLAVLDAVEDRDTGDDVERSERSATDAQRESADKSRLADLGYLKAPVEELSATERERLAEVGYTVGPATTDNEAPRKKKLQDSVSGLQENLDALIGHDPVAARQPVFDRFTEGKEFAAGHALYVQDAEQAKSVDELTLTPGQYFDDGQDGKRDKVMLGLAASPTLPSEGVPETFVGTVFEVDQVAGKRVMRISSEAAPNGWKLGTAVSPSAEYDKVTYDLGRLVPATEKIREQLEESNTEAYAAVNENEFIHIDTDRRSTFSIDVDTASYANVRRHLKGGSLPPAGAVRIEEMINYFSYDYPLPDGNAPFSASLEVAGCPWKSEHRLVRVGLRGKSIPYEARPQMNLVFLLDVSGSMNEPNKLPLVIESMKLLVDSLRADDRVAIVVYAGASGMVLDSTPGSQRASIVSALERLSSGGSTNGAAGIQLAYQVARNNYIDGGVNRVILATDGDFNVGTTSESELVSLVEEKAKAGVYLTVLGFGTGNLNDSLLEAISGKGDGSYGYIDSLHEARKWFVDQVSGSMVTIAKDVKLQIEFNREEVEAFRLIGYENRVLEHQDFNDDRKDAGEIGAGHTVTALYEVVPRGAGQATAPKVDALKYESAGEPTAAALSGELLTLAIRYKEPDTPDAAVERMNGIYDAPEAYTDMNGNGAYDAGEPFVDSNENGAWDGGDVYTDVNGNQMYDLGEPYDDRPSAPPVAASKKLEFTLRDDEASFAQATDDFKFAAAVAAFGMVLRGSEHSGQANLGLVEELAREGLGDDRWGYRAELLELVRSAEKLQSARDGHETK